MRKGWMLVWMLAIPIVAMGATCGEGNGSSGDSQEYVETRTVETRPGGFHDYVIELKDLNGHRRKMHVAPDSRDWKQCKIGDYYPGCAMA